MRTIDTGYYSEPISDSSLTRNTESGTPSDYQYKTYLKTYPERTPGAVFRSFSEPDPDTDPSWSTERTPAMQERRNDEPQAPLKPRDVPCTRTRDDFLESKKVLFKKPYGALRNFN